MNIEARNKARSAPLTKSLGVVRGGGGFLVAASSSPNKEEELKRAGELEKVAAWDWTANEGEDLRARRRRRTDDERAIAQGTPHKVGGRNPKPLPRKVGDLMDETDKYIFF